MQEQGTGRRLPNWIESFTHLTERLEAPALFCKWAGISILSSVLERKVWNSTAKGLLFPNLYVVLVGGPGTGKSIVTGLAEKILREVPELFIAPSSVTAASLIDSLQLAQRKILYPQFVQFNSLQVVASEFQVFMVDYESNFIGLITKLYDCELYEERRRYGKDNHIRIDNTQLSMLAGTTPSYLNTLLHEGAWDQGFTSRTIFVHGEPVEPSGNIFGDPDDDEVLKQLKGDLIHDLKEIMRLFGQSSWTKEAKAAMKEWVQGGLQPVPDHGRLAHYRPRRSTLMLKLCTIFSVARGNRLEVTIKDFEEALDLLLETEARIPEIFRAMSSTPESRTMEDARYFIKQMYEKRKSPVPESLLIAFMSNRIAPQYIDKMILMMERAQLIKRGVSGSTTVWSPMSAPRDTSS